MEEIRAKAEQDKRNAEVLEANKGEKGRTREKRRR